MCPCHIRRHFFSLSSPHWHPPGRGARSEVADSSSRSIDNDTVNIGSRSASAIDQRLPPPLPCPFFFLFRFFVRLISVIKTVYILINRSSFSLDLCLPTFSSPFPLSLSLSPTSEPRREKNYLPWPSLAPRSPILITKKEKKMYSPLFRG